MKGALCKARGVQRQRRGIGGGTAEKRVSSFLEHAVAWEIITRKARKDSW